MKHLFKTIKHPCLRQQVPIIKHVIKEKASFKQPCLSEISFLRIFLIILIQGCIESIIMRETFCNEEHVYKQRERKI